MIAVLTLDFLKTPSCLLLLGLAVKNNQHIILLHDPSSTPFPSAAERPSFLSETFDEKAITYIELYIDNVASQIAKKLKKSKVTNENITTRGFLSHKRSSAQGIAGSLYNVLRADYNLFLDTEATFDLHNLQILVSETKLFIFILSKDIFLSHWCLEGMNKKEENNAS